MLWRLDLVGRYYEGMEQNPYESPIEAGEPSTGIDWRVIREFAVTLAVIMVVLGAMIFLPSIIRF